MSSVDKIFAILELLRENYRTGLTNKEISEKLQIPPSTCYRILAALRKYNLVSQRKPDLNYVLGFAHLRFAEAVIEGMDLPSICLPYLEDIHAKTEETTFFGYFNGISCVVMEMCGFANMKIAVGLGETMPLHASAAGKAIFAFLNRKERDKLLDKIELTKYTEKTITDKNDLEKEFTKILENGVAYNISEFNNGINAVAAPIFGQQNRVAGSLSIVGTSVDMYMDQMDEYTSLLLEASMDISGKIGGNFPAELAAKVL